MLPAIPLDGGYSSLSGKSVAPTIDELLDREERNQSAGKRDRGVKRGERCYRRHAEIAEPGKKVQLADIDHAERRPEDDEAIEGLDDEARAPGHRVSDRREAEMIIAPRRRR